MLNRRRFVAAAASIAARPARAAPPITLDFAKPEDNLTGLVKLEGGLDGSAGVMWCVGMVSRLTPGTLAEPLHGYERCQIRVFRPRAGGSYDLRKRNWLLLKDLKTGAYLPEGGFVARDAAMRYGVQGLQWLTVKTEPATVAGPLLLPWVTNGNDIWVTLSHSLRTPGRDGAMAVETQSLTMLARNDDLYNVDLPNVPCLLDETLIVADGGGTRLFQGHGKKFATPRALPPAFFAESERRYPGIATTPIAWE
jgi:hypothetical protein